MPNFYASTPFIFRAVKTSSLVLATPIILDRVCVPPAPGIRLQYVSGSPIKESFVATLISAFRASYKPPPKAGPSIKQITGQ